VWAESYRTPHAAAVSWFASTSTFRKSTQLNSADICSKAGAIARHGPHQVAVKSTTTHRPAASALASTASNSAFVEAERIA